MTEKTESLFFRLYVIPPPQRLDWSSPRSLFKNTLWNHLIQDQAPIGHLFVEFESPEPNSFGVKKVLTGMSRAAANRASMQVMRERVGLGTFFYDFDGKLDLALDALKENDWALARQRLRIIKVPIQPVQARHMMDELESWIRFGAFRHYGGGHQILRGEGAGCAEFGMHFLSIALQGPATAPNWLRKVIAPRELTGRPKRNERVSWLKILREGRNWGNEDADGFVYQTPDPELIFDWALARGPQDQVEQVLTRDQALWMSHEPLRLPKIEFQAGYPPESDAVLRDQFERIRLA